MRALIDQYSFHARLTPMLVVVLPVGLTTAAGFPNESIGLGFLAGILTSFGLTALLAQVGRDLGKQKEKMLFGRWQGVPTTRLLSNRHTTLDEQTLKRYHAKLRSILSDVHIPTPDEERRDPLRADQSYESCTRYLREKTRNKNRFPLVFEENINYGFRRNLWAMKPAAIVLASGGTLACAALLFHHWASGDGVAVLGIAGLVINSLLVAWWVLRIRPEWVRLAAYAYAERLLGALDIL